MFIYKTFLSHTHIYIYNNLLCSYIQNDSSAHIYFYLYVCEITVQPRILKIVCNFLLLHIFIVKVRSSRLIISGLDYHDWRTTFDIKLIEKTSNSLLNLHFVTFLS